MSRVWKKFFRKLAEPIGIVAYILFAVGLTIWTDANVSSGVSILVFCIMIPVPMLAYLIRDMWRQAKSEVEWENRDIMRKIKGE